MSIGYANPLIEWVQTNKDRFGGMRALAERIGMTESGFFRGVKRGTLTTENLLELAKACDVDPSAMLRMGGKRRSAELIESLYGTPSPMTRAQREISALVGELDPRDHAMAVEMMQTIVAGAIQLRRASSRTEQPAHDLPATGTGSRARARTRKP